MFKEKIMDSKTRASWYLTWEFWKSGALDEFDSHFGKKIKKYPSFGLFMRRFSVQRKECLHLLEGEYLIDYYRDYFEGKGFQPLFMLSNLRLIIWDGNKSVLSSALLSDVKIISKRGKSVDLLMNQKEIFVAGSSTLLADELQLAITKTLNNEWNKELEKRMVQYVNGIDNSKLYCDDCGRPISQPEEFANKYISESRCTVCNQDLKRGLRMVFTICPITFIISFILICIGLYHETAPTPKIDTTGNPVGKTFLVADDLYQLLLYLGLRVGLALIPTVIVLIIIIFTVEYWRGSRFCYDEQGDEQLQMSQK
jgi:hypothetical protein